ncbi:sulfite exporter TauE/SafE family protein, partial [Priestia megaterium]
SLILYMGSNILIGSMLGSYSSHYMNEQGLNVVYGVLALIAVVMMFIPKKNVDEIKEGELQFNKGLASILSLLIGAVAGVLGAGGAFILVPVMLVVLKIPTRITIATSLAVTFISSIGSTVGKLVTHQVPFIPALILVAASLIASPVGAKVGQKMNTKVLQWILAGLILATAIKIWWGLL